MPNLRALFTLPEPTPERANEASREIVMRELNFLSFLAKRVALMGGLGFIGAAAWELCK